MIVSIDWLKDFITIDMPPEELADKLTNIGLESDVVFNGKAIDVELTPNRPDCLSHVGVAREIALLTGQSLTYPQIELEESSLPAADEITVNIENPQKCARYACRIVKNVSVGPSPHWLTDRLETVGLRSINNIVDISNYVLMGLGHPLHTFDLGKIGGNTIVVRTAREGEILTTIDGEIQKLNRDFLLICDAEIPIALAGIMGGGNSEVSGKTKDVLIESAYFDPVTIRKGSKALGLSTEASRRFERGTDYEGLMVALDRTAELISEIAGGEICKGVVDEYPDRKKPPKIEFLPSFASKVAGVQFKDEFIRNTFDGLEIKYTKTPYGYECLIPTFRPDLERPIDLIEELTRIYGYGKIESDISYDGWLGADLEDPMAEINKLKHFFAGLGFNEIFSNSLLSPRENINFFLDKAVELQNPLSSEMSILRFSLFPGLLRSVSHNLRHGESNLALFEYGDTFIKNNKLRIGCDEREEFCGVLCGDKSPKQWKGESQPNDFYTLKGYMESMVKFLKIDHTRFEELPKNSEFSIGQILLSIDGAQICEFGLFQKSQLSIYDIDDQVSGFKLNLKTIRDVFSRITRFSRISRYPGVSRDLSFIVERDLSVGDIESSIREFAGNLLKSLSLYDLYEGGQVGEGFKSVTFNLFFQESSRTLTDIEVDVIVSAIISKVSKNLNAKLR